MNNVNKVESLSSYEACKTRFSSEKAAATYSTRHTMSPKGKREKACIQQALADVHQGAYILDLPCGTGRLSYFLHALGFKVVGADYSIHMIEYAKKVESHSPIQFEQQDIMQISHPDNTFDVTICNRLFHHYPTSETRRLALTELARVTKDVIIISFFNSYSLSALWSKIKNIIRGKKPIDRVAIPYHTIEKDIQACGLKIEASYYCRYGISPQTYLKLIKA